MPLYKLAIITKGTSMSKIKLTDPIREQIIYDLQTFFATEREEHLGNVGAELLLNFIIDEVAPMIYNQALIDTHNLMTEKIDDIFLLELDDLTQKSD